MKQSGSNFFLLFFLFFTHFLNTKRTWYIAWLSVLLFLRIHSSFSLCLLTLQLNVWLQGRMVKGRMKYTIWRWCQSRRGTKACASGPPCICTIPGEACAITSFLFIHGSQFKATVLINLLIFNMYLYSDFYFAGCAPRGIQLFDNAVFCQLLIFSAF